ncbi:hypothetical protein K402DRAFT_275378 [Aulographum hederae CBS 113979]|uniref:Uncharacterized protein n=1 Tax=Aulographum hederae CBS 113979 TaxID=1176131 RepID=A0A6G1GIV8_9PEZI|nr:hypothetical protein K402DRAFT_275378 [Aulographum hederae CBS 113979]
MSRRSLHRVGDRCRSEQHLFLLCRCWSSKTSFHAHGARSALPLSLFSPSWLRLQDRRQVNDRRWKGSWSCGSWAIMLNIS